MDIDDLIQLFTYKTSFAYYKIIEECNNKINNKPSISEYYYFKSMAILGILSIEGKLKDLTCIYKYKSTQYNESIVNQYHSADEALKYYQNAILLNPKIHELFNLSIPFYSDLVCYGVLLNRPIPSIDLLDLLSGKYKQEIIGKIIISLFVLLFAIAMFSEIYNQGVLPLYAIIFLLVYCLGIAYIILFVPFIDKKLIEKYHEAITIIKKK